MDFHIEALIAAFAVVLAAALPSLLNHLFMRKHIGKTNGLGTLAQMNEQMLLWAKEHSASDLAYQDRNDESVAATQAALAQIQAQIDQNTAQIFSEAQTVAEGVRGELEQERHNSGLDGTKRPT